MALFTQAGLFIHVPKCAGLWVRKVIKHEISGNKVEVYPYHGLPADIAPNMRIYAVVRHPASWLQSFWAYRNNIQWRINPNAPPYWPAIVGMTQVYGCDDFEAFIENILRHKPGLMSTIYKLYYHPFITYYKMESELSELVSDLGLDPDEIMDKYPPEHVTPDKPELTPDIVRKIEYCEPWAMETFGYDHQN